MLVVASLGVFAQTRAQQAIVINPEFEFIRQGATGIITLSGPDVVSGTAQVLDRTYPFFPTSAGYACLLSVPMETKIKDYPLVVTITRRDGSKAKWDATLKVAEGQFVLEDPKNFNLPSEKLNLLRDEVEASEKARLLSTYSLVTPMRFWEGAFTMPVNGASSSPFGSWRTFNGSVNRRHTGFDLKAPIGTPVLASASGRVVLSRPLDIHGNNVVIDHGWGVFSSYSHLSERYVVPGQFVLQGDIVGLSGNTGRSVGPHVHWEIAVNGEWVNPVQFMGLKLPN
jgi:murein DD-endopeptidase MepM/ murein hydrolase activator NlpD